jgi:hypothetical protein
MGIPEGKCQQIDLSSNFLLSFFGSLSELSIHRASLLALSSVLLLALQGVAAQGAIAGTARRNTKIDPIHIRLTLPESIRPECRSVIVM